MIGAKITKVLGDDNYEIHVDPIKNNTHPINVGVCHDYALFGHYTHLECEMNSGARIPYGTGGGTTNILPVSVSVQMPIRAMGELILPYLNDSKYLKEEHYTNRCVFGDSPVSFWNDSKTVHVYDKGQKKFVEISRELYKQLNP